MQMKLCEQHNSQCDRCSLRSNRRNFHFRLHNSHRAFLTAERLQSVVDECECKMQCDLFLVAIVDNRRLHHSLHLHIFLFLSFTPFYVMRSTRSSSFCCCISRMHNFSIQKFSKTETFFAYLVVYSPRHKCEKDAPVTY